MHSLLALLFIAPIAAILVARIVYSLKQILVGKHTAPLVPFIFPWLGSSMSFLPSNVPGWRKAYGDAYRLHAFGTHITFTHSTSDAEEVFQTRSLSFVKAYGRFLEITTPVMEFDETKPEGRKIYRGLFTLFNSQLIRSAVENTRQIAEEEFATWQQSGRVDLFSISRGIVMKGIAMVMFGKAAVRDESLWKIYFSSFAELDPELVLLQPQSVFNFRRFKHKAFDRIEQVVKQALAEQSADDGVSGISILQEFAKNQGFTCDSRYLANVFLLFSLGAFTNLYAAVGWALFHLAKNNAWQDKARDEGHDTLQSYSMEELMQCSYTKSLVMEMTRFYARGTFLRQVTEKNGLKLSSGHVVPEGELVALYIPDFSFDPKAWEAPNEIIPERFMNPEAIREKGVFWVGFGRGRHPCLGMNFSLAQSALLVQMLLERFEFEAEAQDIPFNDKQMGTIFKPTVAVMASYHRINSSPAPRKRRMMSV
eukprot:TRINITY_DN869_c0_g1_i1.p1 TRINITY_DN869_c0_g1~~TRINITY_DN869_c0_g1_i1.p1  ORF type:complete len:480 (-),score=108.16 TRINITY_DN869_c0_g1_i1:64-1503(-)